jgi:antitoxin MazE
MKAEIIKIGNSQGIRIPKPLLEQSGISGEVEIEAQEKQIVIRPLKNPRHSWDKAFRVMSENKDDQLLDENVTSQSRWDKEEWEW